MSQAPGGGPKSLARHPGPPVAPRHIIPCWVPRSRLKTSFTTMGLSLMSLGRAWITSFWGQEGNGSHKGPPPPTLPGETEAQSAASSQLTPPAPLPTKPRCSPFWNENPGVWSPSSTLFLPKPTPVHSVGPTSLAPLPGGALKVGGGAGDSTFSRPLSTGMRNRTSGSRLW